MTSLRAVSRTTLQESPVTSLVALAATAGLAKPFGGHQLLEALAQPVKFSAGITTPSGTALGGTVDLTLFSDGRFVFDVHMHDSGFDPYTFRVRCAVQAPNGLTIVFQTSGHTDGTGSNLFGSVDRDFDHHEEAHNPMIQAYWLDVRLGTLSVSKSYEDVGALSTIEDIAKDLLGFLIADVTFGAGLALVICASAEISDAADANFVGVGGLVGVIVAGGVVWTFGPSAILAAVVAGVAAGAITDALVKHRMVTQDEYRFASLVFGDTLPPRERLYVTNLSHGGGRKFTWPNVDQSVLLNLGDAFDDPVGHVEGSGDSYPTRGQVFIHEMTHAWQIQQRRFVPGMMCKAAFETSSYTPSLGTAWTDLGLEQQAASIDQWFNRHANGWTTFDDVALRLQSPAATADPAFAYVSNHIRLGVE